MAGARPTAVERPDSKPRNGDALILTAMALFGSYGLFLRLFPHIPTLAFMVAFQVVGAAVLARSARGVSRRAFATRAPLLVALSLMAIGNDISYFESLRLTSVANAAVAHQSVSVFLLVLAPWLLKEQTRRSEWIGLGVAIVGFAVLYLNDFQAGTGDDLLGISLGLASGLFMAFVIILYRVLPTPAFPMHAVNFGRYAIGIVVLVPTYALAQLPTPGTGDLFPLVAFAVLFGVIGTTIHATGINRTRSLHASIIGKAEPVFAAAYAALFLGEGLTVTTIFGGLLVLGSGLALALLRDADA